MSVLHPTQSALSAIDTANLWINSERLTAERLRGRVVLVDFWTYSCVNWLRTLPYVRAWEERIATVAWWSLARTLRSSGSSTTWKTCNARHASWASATRWSSTTSSRSGGRSRTITGRPSTSSIAKGASAFTISARGPTRRPSGQSSNC